ncbi:hypothetical protein niasHT_005628 [Heterodera trifolii]|uniref:Odorant receptor n=1 Tax=Heterodera trifolii TaxID=157864 RepID=A0ABD2M953_9BILA
MSVPKPRRFTYFERLKSTFNVVHDQETKFLCDKLLSFFENCSSTSATAASADIVDFTDTSMENAVGNFLKKHDDFVKQLLGKYVHFSERGEFDLFGIEETMKNKNRHNAMVKTVDQHCYQVLCLCALFCPVDMQKGVMDALFAHLCRIQPDRVFRPVDHALWTALLLLINPVKLKQQCDGSVEVFNNFMAVLRQPSKCDEPDNFCLKGTISLALGVAIKYARNSLGLGISHELDEIELVNDGIKNMAFEYMQAFIVKAPAFFEFPFSIDVVDSLIKNFICYFRDKLVEMCNLCEEELYSLLMQHDKTAHQQMADDGASMPWQNHHYHAHHHYYSPSSPSKKAVPNFANLHFKTFLELIATLYERETEQIVRCSREFTDPNCEGLYDFVFRNRAISAPSLKIAYLSMLTSLCKSKANSTQNVLQTDECFSLQTPRQPRPNLLPFNKRRRLNPGEWQLGAYGKILPRLPEGTRCGGLVMGKYGLYNPQVRALQEECYPKMLAGVPTERINRNQEITFQMCKWMVIVSVFISAHNFAMMLYGTKEKPLWPYTLFMEKSD